MTARDLRALSARIRVLEAYALGRRAGYLSLGAGRLERAIRRLEEDYRRGREERRLDLIVNPGDVDGLSTRPTRDELVDAFRAEARRRLARRDGEPASVRNALRRAAIELDADLGVDYGDEGPCSLELGLLGVALELETIRDRSRQGRRVTA